MRGEREKETRTDMARERNRRCGTETETVKGTRWPILAQPVPRPVKLSSPSYPLLPLFMLVAGRLLGTFGFVSSFVATIVVMAVAAAYTMAIREPLLRRRRVRAMEWVRATPWHGLRVIGRSVPSRLLLIVF